MRDVLLKNILLVDDDEDDCFLFAEALKNTGRSREVRLQVLSDGEAAIDYLAHVGTLPHVVVLDYNMPRMNGAVVTQLIRRNNAIQDVHLVVLSTCPKAGRMCVEKGADKYYIKPGTLNELTSIVGSILVSADKRISNYYLH